MTLVNMEQQLSKRIVSKQKGNRFSMEAKQKKKRNLNEFEN